VTNSAHPSKSSVVPKTIAGRRPFRWSVSIG
jgi:hypothetical protein